MSEKPIIFSGPMVQAILDGRKTQTRRVVQAKMPLADQIAMEGEGEGRLWLGAKRVPLKEEGDAYLFRCRYGAPGDVLWVRETWRPEGPGVVNYRATANRAHQGWRWRPSIHMPRKAARLFLKVKSIRIEHVQSISTPDVRAEGLALLSKDGGLTWKYGLPDRDGLPGNDDHGWHWHDWDVSAQAAFERLWDGINGERAPWASNPRVWVIEFERVPTGDSNG